MVFIEHLRSNVNLDPLEIRPDNLACSVYHILYRHSHIKLGARPLPTTVDACIDAFRWASLCGFVRTPTGQKTNLLADRFPFDYLIINEHPLCGPYVPSLVRARSYNLIRQLVKRGHCVDVMTLYSDDREQAQAESLKELVHAVHALPINSLAVIVELCPCSPTRLLFKPCIAGIPAWLTILTG